MLLALQAAPLVVLIIVLARGRGGPLAPVAAALALAIPAAAASLQAGTALLSFLGIEALRGAWLALAPAAITAGGLVFHEAVSGAEAGRAEDGPRSHARLFTAVFLLGPFFETVTGFGIGVVFALSAMRRLNVPPPAAASLALLSQVLIPWGALGPGTLLGAALAGVDLRAFGAWTSAASAVWLLLLLPLFWRLSAEAGLTGSARERLADAATMVLLAALLVGANLVATVEIAGLVALSPPLLARLWAEQGGADASARRAALPYVALALLLLATRLVPPLSAALTGVAVLRPFPELPGIALLHHPATMMLAVALAVLAGQREPGRALARAAARARMPVLLMLLYVVLARWLGASGAAASLARALADAAGPSVLPFVTPALGAAGGFFTGTNVASNSILMPIQTALAGSQGFPPAFLPALQNFTGSALCILAPMRIAATAALAADGTTEQALYRRLWWTGAAALASAGFWVAALKGA